MVEKLQKTIADSPLTRWTILVAVSLTMMCGYFLTDAIAPLKTLFEEKLHWDSIDFGIFNSGYGWLNVFLLMMIVGGIILDKKGPRFTGLMAIAVMVAGAGLKYYAVDAMPVSNETIFGIKQQVFTAALGYAIFAFGYETMNITATKLLVRWFSGKELALALGMNVAFARVGTMLAMAAPLRIYEWTNSISAPILFGTAMLMFGLVTFIVVIVMDRKLDGQLATSGPVSDEDKFKVSDIISIIKMKAFWYIAVLCLMFYIAVMSFQKFGTEFLSIKFHIESTHAGDWMSLLPIGALFLTPLFGSLYDRRGKGVSIMTLGCLIIIAVYALFAIPTITSTFAMAVIVILLGISFSLVPSAMWPSVAKIIPQRKLGTAYALIFWVQNIGLANAPLLIGWILERYGKTNINGVISYDYTAAMITFMCFGILALGFAFLLGKENKKQGYGLQLPNIKR